jgi:hypothetical protein
MSKIAFDHQHYNREHSMLRATIERYLLTAG